MRTATLLAIVGISLSFGLELLNFASVALGERFQYTWRFGVYGLKVFLYYAPLLLFLCAVYFKQRGEGQ